MRKKLIVIDPGHGGKDLGATSGSLIEKAINWKAANELADALKVYDVDVRIIQPSTYMNSTTRDELTIPATEAYKLKADLYVSLHVNAGGGFGFESFVKLDCRNCVADRIRDIIHDTIMVVLDEYGVVDRGKKYEDYYVLRNSGCPAILTEMLFIDNAIEQMLLEDDEFIARVMNEYAFGIGEAMGLERVAG